MYGESGYIGVVAEKEEGGDIGGSYLKEEDARLMFTARIDGEDQSGIFDWTGARAVINCAQAESLPLRDSPLICEENFFWAPYA